MSAPATPLPSRSADRDRDVDRDSDRAVAHNGAERGGRRGMRKEEEQEHERADSPDRAARFFRKQRWPGEGIFPSERYLRAKEDAHRLPGIALGSRSGSRLAMEATPTFGNWQALGPGNQGGRIRGIAIDPGNPKIMFIAAASGGVWKTTDGGATWNPLTDFLPVLVAGSLVMDPTNSKVLYLGTGEATGSDIGIPGAGIFKTTDGGQTWNQLAATKSSDFQYVSALVINPSQPAHIYAGTTTGLFRSTDGGASWTAMTLKSRTSSNCSSLAIRSDQPTDYVFAACGTWVGNNLTFSIFRNKDAAGTGTWESVLTNAQMADTAIALAPSAQNTIYALATTNNAKSPFARALLAVYRSTQNGDANSWTKQADTSNPSSMNANILSYPSCTYTGNDHKGQGAYNLFVAVDPKNPNVVFSGGIETFRSDDGGVTWGWTNMYNGGHPDQHAIAFHPGYDGQANQTLWIGNDGGLFRTDSARGATTTNVKAFCRTDTIIPWTDLNNGLAVTQFYHGAVAPGGTFYFGGTQDNGTPIGYDALGPNAWGNLYLGDGGQAAVDAIDPNTMFYEYINLAMRKSVDGGLNNYSATNGITEDPGNFLFINFYTQDPNDPMKMYTGATQLWRTLDEAENWTAASAPIAAADDGSTDTISSMAVDPNDANHLLFGTDTSGRIYRVSNALTSDAKAVFPFSTPRSGYVSRIVFDPTTAGRVYVSYTTFRDSPASDSEIYRSDDGGVNWMPLGLGGAAPLPDVPVNSILLDPDDASRIYAATDTGLVASFDRGITWNRDNNPFADAIVETLVIDHNAGGKNLYAFTHGRGAWRVNLDGGAACKYTLSAKSIAVTGDAALGSVNVSTDASCTWTAHLATQCMWSSCDDSRFVAIQSPATGRGSGHVYFRVPYNDTGQSRSDTIYVQDQAVTITQSTTTSSSHSTNNDLLASAHVVGSLPYGDAVDNSGATSSASDPVHSCTNSADTKTLWWRYAATASGKLIVSVTGEGEDFYGNTGLAITAYPLANGAVGNELACTMIPEAKDADWKAGTIIFPVTSGTTYAIEVSGINADNAYVVFQASMFPSISVSPSNPTIAPGGKLQFSASVSGTPVTGVRWILSPPIGTLDSSGNYTAPALIDGATQVTITARSFADPNATASTTVNIQATAVAFTAKGVVNAASFQSGAVSPGEMVTLFGTGLGPTSLTPLQVDATGKYLVSNIGNTQVTFDGTAAPLIYTSAGQLSAIVPYEVAGKASTIVQVKHAGATSTSVSMPVTDAAPALFTVNQAGSGQAAAQSDYLPNSSAFPAARGSVVVLYGTGEGQTNPPGQDGLLALTAPYPQPVLQVKVTIDGKDAPVQYAGTAPTDVAGILQVNAVVPMNASTGDVPVVLTVGTRNSPSGVTLNILAPDNRMGYLAYNNTGTTPVTITVYKPGSATPIPLGTVKGGAYIYFSSTKVGNDWGVQVNSAPVRIVQHVATFLNSANPQQWSITGTSDNPYPR